MSAIVFEYLCGSCGTAFKAAGISDFSYGEFVLRSLDGYEVFLDSISNPIFEEVARLVESHSLLKGASNERKANAVQEVFSIACDPDPKGEFFQMYLPPKCPKCGQINPECWDVSEPIESMELPSVTHFGWESLTAEEKSEKIDAEIRRVLFGRKTVRG